MSSRGDERNLARGAAARHSGSVGGGGTMHASTRPGSWWRTGSCLHGQSPVWDAALQRPVIAEKARETCRARHGRYHPLQVSVSRTASQRTAREYTPPTPRRATMASQGESARVARQEHRPRQGLCAQGPAGGAARGQLQHPRRRDGLLDDAIASVRHGQRRRRRRGCAGGAGGAEH